MSAMGANPGRSSITGCFHCFAHALGLAWLIGLVQLLFKMCAEAKHPDFRKGVTSSDLSHLLVLALASSSNLSREQLLFNHLH